MKHLVNRILCVLLGHDLVYWDEQLERSDLRIEFGRCERCVITFVSDIRND